MEIPKLAQHSPAFDAAAAGVVGISKQDGSLPLPPWSIAEIPWETQYSHN